MSCARPILARLVTSVPENGRASLGLSYARLDAGNIEDELFVLVFCKKDDAMQRITSCTRYLCVKKPERVDAQGLVDCLESALAMLGINNVTDLSSKPVPLGIGTDGVSANISGKNGMRGIIQR